MTPPSAAPEIKDERGARGQDEGEGEGEVEDEVEDEDEDEDEDEGETKIQAEAWTEGGAVTGRKGGSVAARLFANAEDDIGSGGGIGESGGEAKGIARGKGGGGGAQTATARIEPEADESYPTLPSPDEMQPFFAPTDTLHPPPPPPPPPPAARHEESPRRPRLVVNTMDNATSGSAGAAHAQPALSPNGTTNGGYDGGHDVGTPAPKPALPPGWAARYSERKARAYYVHTESGRTQWDPPEPPEPPSPPTPPSPDDPLSSPPRDAPVVPTLVGPTLVPNPTPPAEARRPLPRRRAFGKQLNVAPAKD